MIYSYYLYHNKRPTCGIVLFFLQFKNNYYNALVRIRNNKRNKLKMITNFYITSGYN